MRPGGAVSLACSLDLLERSIGYARGALALVPPRGRRGPTPCSRWDLVELLVHLDDSLLTLSEAAELGYVELGPRRQEETDDLPDRIRTRACAVLGSWCRHGGAELVSVAGSPLSAGVTASAGALEIAVHGWDVARSCGARTGLPPALARDLSELAPLLVTEADRPVRFARALAVPTGATASEQLLAHLGRRS